MGTSQPHERSRQNGAFMRIAKTTDTGSVGDVYALADELLADAEQFQRATAAVPGELFIAFRSLPREYGRRSTVRYVSADDVLYLDVAVAEEDIAELTFDEQRDLLRSELRALVQRGVRSRTAGWSRAQRHTINSAFEALLSGTDAAPGDGVLADTPT